MGKKLNVTWLFLVLAVVVIAVAFVLMYTNQSADSYSGGLLVELPIRALKQCAVVVGGSQ